jgi:NAD(P)-dependent dehydrogenase (short-subunit alcohol dehydrogenase family)
MNQTWNGKNVLITGGSRGLGAALVDALSARGAGVVVVARGESALAEVVEKWKRAGRKVFGITADVADKDSTHRISGLAAALVGHVDVVIHNASTLGPTPLRALLDTECEDLAQVLETNVVGPFRLTKALVGPMVLRRSGTVVHVSSDAAVEGYPNWGAYGASKATGDQLHRVLAAELKESGVRVLMVDPGEMDTQMHRDAVPEANPAELRRPRDVAEALVALLEKVDGPPSGTRLALEVRHG